MKIRIHYKILFSFLHGLAFCAGDFYKKSTQKKQKIFDWLLQEKADINSSENSLKLTPLHMTVCPDSDVDFALYLLR